jgi:hypothetical protein
MIQVVIDERAVRAVGRAGKFGLGVTALMVWLARPEITPDTPVTSPSVLTVIWPAAVNSESNDSNVNL